MVGGMPLDLALVMYPDPSLRKPSRPVEAADLVEGCLGRGYGLSSLVSAMTAALPGMRGYALAAVQVGFPVQVVVVASHPDLPADAPAVILNPRMEPGTGGPAVRFAAESCLSMPGVVGPTRRLSSLVVAYEDLSFATRTYACHGLFAVVVQHELDHLAGVTFEARVDPWDRAKIDRQLNKLRTRR